MVSRGERILSENIIYFQLSLKSKILNNMMLVVYTVYGILITRELLIIHTSSWRLFIFKNII